MASSTLRQRPYSGKSVYLQISFSKQFGLVPSELSQIISYHFDLKFFEKMIWES
jgi:hypothetical protein